MADLQQLGNILGGFSAGIQGNLPQYQQVQNQTRQLNQQEEQQRMAAEQERLKTYYQDASAGLKLLESGNLDAFLNLGKNRLELLSQFQGADPSDTQRWMQLGVAGKQGSREAIERLKAELESVVDLGMAYGVLEAPQAERIPASEIVNGQIIERSPTGSYAAVTPSGMTPQVEEQFTLISPQEAVQLGLPADRQFQRNSKTNQISQIGGTGTTVNVNQGNELGPGPKKLDELYAQEYYNWRSGGGADQFANIASIETVLGKLERGENLTGPMIGLAPDWANALLNPEALNAKQNIEEVVQRNLRILLGAQFTEREGERLIARAFDARLGPKENAARLRKLLQQMNTAASQKEKMAEFFEKNGSLMGYRGPVPNVQDFFSAISGVAVGEVIDGYRYTGGDPGSPESWVKQ